MPITTTAWICSPYRRNHLGSVGTNVLKEAGEPHCGHLAAFLYYNFCRIHQSLRVTPAMAANVTDRVWDVEDIVKLLENKLDDLKDWRDAYFTGE